MRTLAAFAAFALASSIVGCGNPPTDSPTPTRASANLTAPQLEQVVKPGPVKPHPAPFPPMVYPVAAPGQPPPTTTIPADFSLGATIPEPPPVTAPSPVLPPSPMFDLSPSKITPHGSRSTNLPASSYNLKWLQNCGSFTDNAVQGLFVSTDSAAISMGTQNGLGMACTGTGDDNAGDEGAAVGFEVQFPASWPPGETLTFTPKIDVLYAWMADPADLTKTINTRGWVGMYVLDTTTNTEVIKYGIYLWNQVGEQGFDKAGYYTNYFWSITAPLPSGCTLWLGCQTQNLDMVPGSAELPWMKFAEPPGPLQASFSATPGHSFYIWIWTGIQATYDPDTAYPPNYVPENQDAIIVSNPYTTMTESW